MKMESMSKKLPFAITVLLKNQENDRQFAVNCQFTREKLACEPTITTSPIDSYKNEPMMIQTSTSGELFPPCSKLPKNFEISTKQFDEDKKLISSNVNYNKTNNFDYEKNLNCCRAEDRNSPKTNLHGSQTSQDQNSIQSNSALIGPNPDELNQVENTAHIYKSASIQRTKPEDISTGSIEATTSYSDYSRSYGTIPLSSNSTTPNATTFPNVTPPNANEENEKTRKTFLTFGGSPSNFGNFSASLQNLPAPFQLPESENGFVPQIQISSPSGFRISSLSAPLDHNNSGIRFLLAASAAKGAMPSAEKRVGHPYQSRLPARHKKPRTSFTKAQVAYLETRFVGQKYLASAERAKLAVQLDMSDSQIKTWFQNRRTKWRRQEAEEREYEGKTAAKLLSLASSYIFPTINTAITTSRD